VRADSCSIVATLVDVYIWAIALLTSAIMTRTLRSLARVLVR